MSGDDIIKGQTKRKAKKIVVYKFVKALNDNFSDGLKEHWSGETEAEAIKVVQALPDGTEYHILRSIKAGTVKHENRVKVII